MDDPRFYFPTTPGSGSIMYYSTVYNKWTGSDTNKFSWDAVSNILKLKGVLRLTDQTTSSYYNIESQSDTFIIAQNGTNNILLYNPITDEVVVPNLSIGYGYIRMVDGGGNELLMLYDPLAGGFTIQPPATTSQFLWTPTGLISTVGSGAGLKLGDRTILSNYYTLLSTGSILKLQYNGADTGVSFDTTGIITSDALEMRDQTNTANKYKLVSTGSILKLQYNGTNTGVSFDTTGIITSDALKLTDQTVSDYLKFTFDNGVLGFNTTSLLSGTTLDPINDIITTGFLKALYLVLPDTNTPANEFQISHSYGILSFTNIWSPSPVPLQLSGNDGDTFVSAYNLYVSPYVRSTVIELDTPLISDYTSAPALGIVSKETTTNDYIGQAVNSTNTWTFPVNGNNPNNRQLTFSTVITSSGTMSISAGVNYANHPTITFTSYTVSATRNGSAFTAFQTTSSRATGTVYSYTFTAGSSAFIIIQPITQLGITFIPTDSGEDDTYVFTITATITKGGYTGMTWGTGSVNYSGAGLYLSASYTPTSGTGTCVLFSGNALTGIAASLTKDLPINSTYTTVSCDLLQSKYINISYQGSFTATTSTTFLNCFRGGYENYEIQLRFTTAPTAYSALLLQLATSTGVEATTNYQGQISTLGSFTSAGHASSSFTLANLPSNLNITMSWILYNPNVARATTITGTNTGSTSASFITVPQIISGLHITATAYPSITISCANNIAGFVIIRGFN